MRITAQSLIVRKCEKEGIIVLDGSGCLHMHYARFRKVKPIAHLIQMAAVMSVLFPAGGYCDSSGEYPGTGSYTKWLQAADACEDGVVYARKGNYTMALRCYDEAIELYGQDASFHFNKGIALRKTGKTKEALLSLKKAVELEPKFASAWYNLGNAQEDDHDFPSAEASFRQALKLDQSHMHAWFNLGEVLLQQTKLPEAKDAFNHALALPCTAQDKKDVHEYLQDIERREKNSATAK